MKRGKILLVIGPTGSGKGTLIDHLRLLHPEVRLAVSATTRAPRPGEVNGAKYHFLSEEAFKRSIEAGEFLEWAVYGGNYYGTLKAPVEAALQEGAVIILEIEIQGVRQVLALFPEDTVSLYVDAGSWQELEARVRARAPISDAELGKRKKQYEDECAFKAEADIVVSNKDGELEGAKKRFVEAVESVLR